MRFVSFHLGPSVHLGVLFGGAVIDLTAGSADSASKNPFGSMREYLEAFDADARSLVKRQDEIIAAARASEALIPLTECRLAAPLPNPASFRDGYAFREHVETMRKSRGLKVAAEFEQFPVFYFSNHQAVCGPGEVAVSGRQLEQLDYELEAGVVIGRAGRDIKAADADKHIFGLLIINDLSARALQREEMQLSLGPAKGKDFATATGPYVVTVDELLKQTKATKNGNQYQLAMQASVNGETLSRGNLGSMHWTFAQIIERASAGVRLFPGDIIGSGTVGSGCLAELNASGALDDKWLQIGDEVALEIEQLGVLKTNIVKCSR